MSNLPIFFLCNTRSPTRQKKPQPSKIETRPVSSTNHYSIIDDHGNLIIHDKPHASTQVNSEKLESENLATLFSLKKNFFSFLLRF